MNKILIGIAGAALLIGVAFLAFRSHDKLVSNLPPIEQPMPRIVAFEEARAFAKQHDGFSVIAILGTGSMAPYIPASPAGTDPRKTVVAYAVVGGKFEDVQTGTLCAYKPQDREGELWFHLASAFTHGGWIMTGLANDYYESWMRMTPKEFKGYTLKVFLVQQ